MSVGQRLRELRQMRGMTQDDLAKALGVPQPCISRLEKQTGNQVIESWIRLAKALGVTVEELYGDFPCEKIS